MLVTLVSRFQFHFDSNEEDRWTCSTCSTSRILTSSRPNNHRHQHLLQHRRLRLHPKRRRPRLRDIPRPSSRRPEHRQPTNQPRLPRHQHQHQHLQPLRPAPRRLNREHRQRRHLRPDRQYQLDRRQRETPHPSLQHGVLWHVWLYRRTV